MAEDDSRAADQIGRAAGLRDAVARLAGDLAETEEQVAAVRRQMAADHPERAEAHLAAAVEAEEFAARERCEQARRRQEG
ncbi:hypothetical protein EV385_1409 [Krasilnikovia cinnamomea]|uniref:Uncharacterized protein n=1 Tax=Krasilnikovia cinnamomea TaxID=349313 RepID=A0A4V2G6R1_9ACTN|nr:hypothetical protein [Krasilnikovia cinnamomea]RZU49656.1 hypothetical protein EV385_1409 [Krasilnikovia cinnamomea]